MYKPILIFFRASKRRIMFSIIPKFFKIRGYGQKWDALRWTTSPRLRHTRSFSKFSKKAASFPKNKKHFVYRETWLGRRFIQHYGGCIVTTCYHLIQYFLDTPVVKQQLMNYVKNAIST